MVSILIVSSFNLFSQVYINEIMASNATVHADIDYGKYCDWIELYNGSGSALDIGGYSLTTDASNPKMWLFPFGTVIPANDYILVYADGRGNGLHTNFRLDKQGEQLSMLNDEGMLVSSLFFTYQLTDKSYGRQANDPSITGYFDTPTPGSSNGNTTMPGVASKPVFSHNSGFYSGPQTITITTENPLAEVYFTLDGTVPDRNSDRYSVPLQFSTNSVLRVKVYLTGMYPRPVETRSYFIDEPQNLPVISVVTNPDHFFSDETGIYVKGTNGVPGYCTDVPHNVNQDWERPVNIELIEKDGTVGVNQVVGAKIFGGCSRVRYPIKSLGFYARKEYETSSIQYKLFPDRESVEYETFILRAGGDDQPITLIREPLTHMLVKDVMDVDVQAYRPVVVYINGEYWGIHNMREKINEHYINDNYGLSPDSVSMLRRNPESSWNVLSGSADHYNAMIEYIRNNDITQKSNYDFVSTQMDIDEYINYQIVQIFFGGRDWPGNNIKFWRSTEEPYNRWRWILYDLDQMFKEYFSDIMKEATEVDCGCSWPNPPWSTFLFRRLLENEEFKNEFIQRFSIYSNSIFSRDRIHRFIDEMEAVLEPEIPRHSERWGGQKADLPDNTWMSPIFSSLEQWKSNMQVIKDFTDIRHEMAFKHVQEYFGISGLNGFEAAVIPGGAGIVKIGGLAIADSMFRGDFNAGEILSVEYKPNDGYLFSHWEIYQMMERDSALVKKGDTWKYLVSPNPPPDDWKNLDFDDSGWSSGPAELGYGDNDEATSIGYGGDSGNKYITTSFRKQFLIEDTSKIRRYTLNLLRDDGAKIYLNGREVVRDNLQRWSTGYYSTAETGIDGTNESMFHTFHVNPALFRNGYNILAVEIHQVSPTSSDISFDMELLATGMGVGDPELSQEEKLQIGLSGLDVVKAFFMSDTTSYDNLFINEIMSINVDKYQDEAGEYEDWIELYNANDFPINLAGLYLADSLPANKPWRFPLEYPELTTIDPFDYLVVFADNQPEQGLLHAGFKLRGTGEEVALLRILADDTIIIDHIVFGAQYGNVAWGRYPDGSEHWEFMPVITPWDANFWEPLDTTTVEMYGNENVPAIYPVPTNGPLFISFINQNRNSYVSVEISIYSITGALVSKSHHTQKELIELSLAEQPPGLYLVRVRMDGDAYDRKIIVF